MLNVLKIDVSHFSFDNPPGDPAPSAASVVAAAVSIGAPPSLTNPLWIIPAMGASFAVTGTFFQATQPVYIKVY